ncbi:GNAT family N-acetyltransferase [Pseudemcibacter aquimaris]|uniref:GNAT family N-acetyltransferase n=1 Tax=Pseudemcibacter aquimaris TaxID=2857064 RepID=UPI002012B20E|nr:GNAT family protein [Pseudemcibacter aquimaris]MCC3861013.1 GNAT family N-acetyltransferase [Pseudemcibacter aquimaris]WDU59831.1 GNAT family N-acetyltransferase [Pseudemcibacter aquimaris]
MKFVPLLKPDAQILAMGEHVHLQLPANMHKKTFVDFVERNKKFHEPWVYVSTDPSYYDQYLRRMKMGRTLGAFVHTNESNDFVGVINLNSIRLDPFSTATLGYYAEENMCGKGYMKEGILLMLDHAFKKVGLNRVEVNVQPDNLSSIALVKSCGFTHEGFSRKFLKIGSDYKDHERWAYLAEDF